MADALKHEITYEAELTGLLIVDPYNDFLSEGGKLYQLSRATLEALNVVPGYAVLRRLGRRRSSFALQLIDALRAESLEILRDIGDFR